ncbi:protein regulator of cytokinesis 1-like [Panulirus ornatus]|uniref:protein regulator of cytokinesis 1-like n=1 Tax=Panulirus ornatus TaxID=150431 RepID=UPI003A87ABFD
MENQENEVVQELRNITSQLHELWNEIGFEADECVQRQSRITELVKDLLKRVLEGEATIKKKLLTSVDENGKEFYHLNTELGTTIPDPEDNLTLLELERYLRHNVEKLHVEVKRRREKLKDLQEQEQELCERLIEEPYSISKRKIPSKEDLEDLERRIRTLEQEKVNREKTFRRLKSNLARLMEELEQKPNSSFEHSILSDVEDLFTLSHRNLQQVKHLNEEYEKKVKNNEKESLQLQEQIRCLYDRLGVDPIERDHFLGTIWGYTPSTLKKLREELQRLEELKKQNMARFINQLRRELEILWEKCYISEKDRNAFTPYTSENYVEEVLQAHDKEVQRLQKYFAENKHIFFKIKQRHELWRKLMELEERANDPNRLFGNRGCSLLQEEKERKRVKNVLKFADDTKLGNRSATEIERQQLQTEIDKLMDWAHKWQINFDIDKCKVLQVESENRKIQMHRSLTYVEKLCLGYPKENIECGMEKVSFPCDFSKYCILYFFQQTARAKQLNVESRLGTRPQSAKRRIARNDTIKTSKLRRIGEDEPSGNLASTPARGMKAVLQEHDQNTMKNVTLQLFPKKDGASILSTDVSSYSQFSDGIQRRSERENIRSSTVHGLKKTPLLVCQTTPRRPPPGLPKTPKTLPRVATRRSTRLNASRTNRRSPRNSTVSRMAVSPAPSTTLRSPHGGVSRLTTPNRWSKLSFLI